MRTFFAVLLLIADAVAQQQPPPVQTRDLVRAPASFKKNAATGKPEIATGYALVIGVGHFADGRINPLRYAESDAQEVFRVLISPHGGYNPQNVHKLIGADATLANVKRELEQWLPSRAGPTDRVVIYFAGHGFVDKGKGYLALYDTTLDRLLQTAYPMATLGQVVGTNIRSKWKALLTDACHSGSIQQITKETTNQAVNENLNDVGAGTGLFTFSASRGDEQSFEDPSLGGGHGLFTYFLVQGLEGQADESGDGIVTAEELAYYVTRSVHDYARRKGATQNPNSGKNEYDGGMIMAFDASRLKMDSEVASREGRIVVQSNMDDVEVRLNGTLKGVVGKTTPLELPGLLPGDYTIEGARRGYEPDGPRTIQVRPGETTTVPINIRIKKNIDRKAEDVFNRGYGEYENKGTLEAYRKAAADFERALQMDPKYSEAALFAGRAWHMASDLSKAQADFQKALAIDPDYTEARVSYAGMLLDRGDTTEAIRQLSEAVAREPRNALAYSHMAHAYRMAGDYEQCVDAARKSIELDPKEPVSHLWLGDCLRLQGQITLAKTAYEHALQLSNYNPGMSGRFSYYVIGSFLGPIGSKRAASRRDVNRDERNLSYLGLCSCELEAGRVDAGITACEQALHWDSQDPYSYYLLGNAYIMKYSAAHGGEKELLLTAQKNYNRMLALNSDLEESDIARRQLKEIEKALRRYQ
jgi:tetratricopeptide (TPR) repeat protein